MHPDKPHCIAHLENLGSRVQGAGIPSQLNTPVAVLKRLSWGP